MNNYMNKLDQLVFKEKYTVSKIFNFENEIMNLNDNYTYFVINNYFLSSF